MAEEKKKSSVKPEKIDSKNRESSIPKESGKLSSAGNLANKEKIDTNKKTEEKVEEKKAVKKVAPGKKDVAIANGFGMKISPKQCKYTCRVIRGKSPDAAIARLQAVIDEKRPVPMAALEVGHKRGKGLAGGKFPKNACRGIMEIVKQAAANAIVADIDNPVVYIAKSNQAAAPFRKAGRKAKRTHIYIEVRDKLAMAAGRRPKAARAGATRKSEVNVGEGRKK